MDRFDLEQAIMTLWSTADDIKAIADAMEEGKMIKDDAYTALHGLALLHAAKSDRCFEIFEHCIRAREFRRDEDFDEWLNSLKEEGRK